MRKRDMQSLNLDSLPVKMLENVTATVRRGFFGDIFFVLIG